MGAALPPLFNHQATTVEHLLANDRSLDLSDAGTGKTRSHLEAFARRKAAGTANKMVVLGTLSILETAWADDIKKWTPHLTSAVVYSTKRKRDLPRAIADDVDVIILNHDAVKWMADAKGKLTDEGRLLADYADVLVVDEFTAFKHRTSQRSKAASAVRHHFPIRWALSGTPNSNGICDIWHPVYIVDDGERLGRAFWGFRAQVCTPIPNHNIPGGNHVDWVDKEDAELIVADKIHDICVRHKLRECIDMPENVAYTVETSLPKKLMAQYQEMQNEAVLLLESGEAINAVHAGAKINKLLQICSGTLWDGDQYHVLDTARVKLALDLAQEAPQALVAFNWRHQRDQLMAEAAKRGMSFAVIDGDVPVAKRVETVNKFQAGEIHYIFAHPQAAGHGLTLTQGTRTIWTSPTYNAEWFQQFNARIDRAGQTQRTETIMIAAKGTRETAVYEKLSGKLERMGNLLHVFAETTSTR
ncbi:SNF2-related protein [Vreelandella massiliensis]|uniref:SNF2-related protein n=1 Tax=Vreelandella massiliensis TaxID=1816686 RepID=UPI00096AB14E|nr:SNF2-related protein [Halomonas massiliensis]